MNRRLVAAGLLAVLTILGGLDLLEDTGLIHYSTTQMDDAVEDVLDNYGEAIRSAEIALATSANLNLRVLGNHDSNSQDAANVDHILRRKRSLDFAGSAFTPLKYSQVFVV